MALLRMYTENFSIKNDLYILSEKTPSDKSSEIILKSKNIVYFNHSILNETETNQIIEFASQYNDKNFYILCIYLTPDACKLINDFFEKSTESNTKIYFVTIFYSNVLSNFKQILYQGGNFKEEYDYNNNKTAFHPDNFNDLFHRKLFEYYDN